jgi:hypothetical protein
MQGIGQPREYVPLAKSSGFGNFETITELVDYYYGNQMQELQKTAGPIMTSSTNYRNILYGRKLWLQMNVMPNAFTAIPREPYETSGWRLVGDIPNAATTTNGVAEIGTIPSVSAIPDITVLEATPKTLVNDPYQISMAQKLLAGKDDVATWDEISNVLGTEFPMRINGQILANVGTAAAGVSLESIDRVCSSHAEWVRLGSAGTNLSDYLGLSRHTAASWKDAFVSSAASNREFSLNLMDSVLTGVRPYLNGKYIDKKVFLTGYDTQERMMQISQSIQRIGTDPVNWVNHQVTFNGVKTLPGAAVGFGVSKYQNIPVICDPMTTVDTAGLSRVYFLDTDFLGLKILKPPTFLQDDANFIARGNLSTVATYYMLGELVCTKFRNQGKIRDIC